MPTDKIQAKLLNALTEYDRRASKRKGYNPYALGHYFAALERVREAMANGTAIRQALLANFNGRLLSAALKAVGEPDFTLDEIRAAQPY